MNEPVANVVTAVSPYHLNLLLLMGLAILGGTIGARWFQRFHIPQVVAYFVIGLLVGESGLRLIRHDLIENMAPFSFFALGLIGFMIGGELRREVFDKYGKKFFAILLGEGLSAFVLVTALTIPAAWWFLRDVRSATALGLLLGSISSATAPAATVDVLWEYKTRGVLTTTVLAIVALDDGLALLLYGLANNVSGVLVGESSAGVAVSILRPVYSILGAVFIGVATGLMLTALLRRTQQRGQALTFAVGSVLLIIGLSVACNVDLILSAMVLGMTVVNAAPRRSREVFEHVERFVPPIYVLFFVLVGARLHIAGVAGWMWVITLLYVVGRTVGKMLGSRGAALWANAADAVRRYLPLCLFSQAGVAIGLAILAGQRFAGPVGDAVITVVTASTVLVQLVGPPCVRIAVKKAGEIGLNVTEKDLIESYTVSDVMDKEPPVVSQGAPLMEVLRTLSEHDYLTYPVVDDAKNLVGIVSFDTIKNTFVSGGLSDLLLAYDLMDPAQDMTTPETPLADAIEMMREFRLDALPVVADERDHKLVGFVESELLKRALVREIVRRREKAETV